MADNKPTASLTLSGNTLRVHGNGPISANFNKEMVKRLFTLPPHPNLNAFGTQGLAASDILMRLSKPAYASFLQVINSDPELKAEHDLKVATFAAYAHPTTGEWLPLSDGLMVLESIPVDLPFLLSITWMLDGTVMLGMLTGTDIYSLKPEEFLSMMGKTYREYCEEQLPLTLEKCQRALSLIAVDSPKKAVVSFINKDSAFEKKTMVYWQDDQVDLYLRRHELSHIATEPEDPPHA